MGSAPGRFGLGARSDQHVHQVVGRPYREDVVLALMKVIETGVKDDSEYPRITLPK